MAKTEFDEFVAKDVNAQKGVSIPVRAGTLERLFVRKVACSNLHPNAEDEFTYDTVGPSYKIIGEYEKKFRHAIQTGQEVFDEPLIVEKLRPSGYLLLNGHHRWAAAMRVGIKKVPVKIVNQATESDIQKILENSRHDKRVALDLDEVIFRPDDYPHLEKALGFPRNLKYKQRIRLGTPALFYYLAKNGYDIWVYAHEYYSIDDIRGFFKGYSVYVDGIITGIGKKQKAELESAKRVEKMISNKYTETIHIDNDMIIVTRGKTGDFEEYELNCPDEEWATTAITILGEIEKNEKNKE